jgi:hypothetical protein
MGMTRIGLNAPDTTVRLVGHAEDEDVPEGQVGVVLTDHVNQYEITVVGTAQTLRGLVYDGLCHPVPDGVPLVDADEGIESERAERARRGTEGWV